MNTITAQVIQVVGPARVVRLAHSMGVRQSKLDEVLSLTLGTSPVTLKEMVSSSLSDLGNGGCKSTAADFPLSEMAVPASAGNR